MVELRFAPRGGSLLAVPAPENSFEEWLSEVAADPILVEDGEGAWITEARANLWGFGFSDEKLRGVSEEDVVRFVRAVEDARERQILQRFGGTRPMTFYCWMDELAGELRLSMVSISNARTGFSGPIEEVDLGEIARQYLACNYHDGIPMGEFRPMTQEDIDADVEPPPIVPRVWVSVLPRRAE